MRLTDTEFYEKLQPFVRGAGGALPSGGGMSAPGMASADGAGNGFAGPNQGPSGLAEGGPGHALPDGSSGGVLAERALSVSGGSPYIVPRAGTHPG